MTVTGRLRGVRRAARQRPVTTALLAVGVAAAGRTLGVLADVPLVVGAPVASPVLALLAGFAVYRATAAPDGWTVGGTSAGIVPERPVVVRALAVGGLGVLALQGIAHGLDLAALSAWGVDPDLVVEGRSPTTRMTSTEHVLSYLLFGVLLTAVGEEVLFRGVLLGTLAERVGFHRANAVQAVLFGAWHLAWPLVVAIGPFEPPVPIALYALGFVLVPGVVGGAFGVLARATGTLWTAVLAHVVHNGVALFVHVRPSAFGRPSVLSATLVAGYALLAGLTWWRWGDRAVADP